MMMLLVFLAFGFFIRFVYHRKKDRGVFLSLFIVFPFLIFSPSLQWSYLFDDIDNFYRITQIAGPADLAQYLVSSQEGHVLLLTRILYLLNYQLFWLDPLFYHIVIILGTVALSLFVYKIILHLTQSWGAALTGGILVGWFTGCLQVMETAFSPFIFSMVFIFSVLYSVTMYSETNNRAWVFAAATAAFFAPLVFAFGVLTGIWVFLFALLCLSSDTQNFWKIIRSLAPVFLAWLGGVTAYYIFAKPEQSLFLSGIGCNVKDALWLTLKSFLFYTVPLTTPVEKLSLFLGVFLMLFALVYRKNIPWRILSFFILWLFGHYLFVFFARGYGSGDIISTERYHFPPLLALLAGYAVILSVILLDPYWKGFRIKANHISFLILIAVFHAYLQYNNVLAYSQNKGDLNGIGRELKGVIACYLQANPGKDLQLENKISFSLGHFSLLTRECRVFTDIFLPPDLRRRITWEAPTEEGFMDFVRENKHKYPKAYAVFMLNGYLS